jgi:hypothetical protein
MKLIARLLPLLLLSPWMGAAQQFAIDWYKISGGGGTSSGGPYTVSGTIGQADAATLSGGNFNLAGGFWSGAVAVQQIGAPTLEILMAGPGLVTLSWTPKSTAYVLQVTDNLTAPNWQDVPGGSLNPITMAAGFPTKFFRLHRQ